jgi:hypothetical protein
MIGTYQFIGFEEADICNYCVLKKRLKFLFCMLVGLFGTIFAILLLAGTVSKPSKELVGLLFMCLGIYAIILFYYGFSNLIKSNDTIRDEIAIKNKSGNLTWSSGYGNPMKDTVSTFTRVQHEKFLRNKVDKYT